MPSDMIPDFFNDVLDEPLPSSPDAERIILAAILLDNNLIIQAIEAQLKVDDFYSLIHQGIYEAMLELHRLGSNLDPILITEEVRKKRHLETIGGIGKILEITAGYTRYTDIYQYVKVVRDNAITRRLVRTCNVIIKEALDRNNNINDVSRKAETTILKIRTEVESLNGGSDQEDFVPLIEIVPEMQAQFEGYNRNESSGIKTGMEEVDQMLDGGGLQPSGLYIIGGAEKSGKTSLALDWGYHAATTLDLEVDIATTEMAKVTLAKRIFSAHTGIPYSQFRPGFHGKNYMKAIEDLLLFAQIPIRISDKLRTVEKIASRLRRRVENGRRKGQRRVGLGIIDYMQLIELDDDNVKQSNRSDVVSDISRAFKLLATELEIPLVVMSSLNRLGMGAVTNGQTVEAQRPDSINIRDSGTIGFDAEALFFVHNPSYIPGRKYTPTEVTDIDLILSRQRNGPTGDIPLKFLGPYMQFMTASQYAKYSAGGKGPRVDLKEKEIFNEFWIPDF